MDINALLNTAAAAGTRPALRSDTSAASEGTAFSDQLPGILADVGDDVPDIPETTAAGNPAENDPVADMIAGFTGITASIPTPPGADTSPPLSLLVQGAAAEAAPDLQGGTTLKSTGLHQQDSGITAIREDRAARSDRLLQHLDGLSQPITAADHPATAVEEAQSRATDGAHVSTISAKIPPRHVAMFSQARIAPQAAGMPDMPATSADASRSADEIVSMVPQANNAAPAAIAAAGLTPHAKTADRDATTAQALRNIAAESATTDSDKVDARDDRIWARALPLPPGNNSAPPTEPVSEATAISGLVELQSDGLANPPRLAQIDGQSGHSGIPPQVESRATSPNPLSVIRQIADAVVTTRNEAVEITLSPEELGRVRMVLTGHERAPHLAIWAERPEILEQMRRNADLLMQQFGEEGLPDATLSFHDHRQHGDAMNDDQRFGTENRDNPPDTSTAAITGSLLGRETPLATGIHRLDVRM